MNDDHPGQLVYEKIPPWEVMVDEIEGRYGAPRQLFHKKLYNRDQLMAMYPSAREYIRDVKSESKETDAAQSISTQIAVVEAWHLPSTADSTDGRHAICIENRVLFTERFERQRFPFVFIRFSERPLGFWSQGLVEMLAALQNDLNAVTIKKSRSIKLLAQMYWLVERSSGIVETQINNDIGTILSYDGIAPVAVNPPVYPEILDSYEDRMMSRMYQVTGVSETNAQAKKPDGLDSGVALREYQDQQSVRQTNRGDTWDTFFLDCAQVTLEISREIFSRDKKLIVRVPGSKFVETIDWKDIKLEEDQYFLKMWPTNLLTGSPADKKQSVQEMMQANLIDPAQGRRMLTGMPDLDAVMNLENAGLDNLSETFDRILQDGDMNPPEELQDLDTGMQMAQQIYLQAKYDGGVPQERLGMLQNWIAQAKSIKEDVAARAAAQSPSAGGLGGPPAGAGGAAAEAPPQSDLIPNSPGATA